MTSGERAPLFLAVEALADAVAQIPGVEPILMADLDSDDPDETWVRDVTAHCPDCGSTELGEMDWDCRWNSFHDFGFGLGPGNTAELFVSVMQADSEFTTLAYFCQNCGQVLDMSGIEVVWS